MRIDVSRSLRIPGWMGDTELRWLAEAASRCRVVVEVGCWMGRSTVALAQHVIPSPSGEGGVWAVDTWRGSEEHAAELEGKPRSWLFEQFWSNVSDLPCVHPLPMTSVDAAAYLFREGVRAGLVFLDASHDLENVRADILAWQPLVAPGGILAGHDLRDSWPGVRQAVEELVPGWRMADPADPRNSIWVAPPAPR